MIDLNFIIAISLAALAFVLFCLLLVIVPVALQFFRTLSSLKDLLDTVNNDVTPTVKEINQSMSSVKNVIQNSSSTVKSTLDEASIFVLSSAYGVLAGVKDYLSGYKNDKAGYNGRSKVRKEERNV